MPPTDSDRSFDCRLLPHGVYALLPATLSTMAWVASLAQDGCDYSRLTGPSVSILTGSDKIPYLEVGFNAYRAPTFNTETGDWQVMYSGRCEEYPGEVPDIWWKISKALSFIALVLGGGGALFLWFSTCFVFGPGTWRWAGYEVFGASIFQALSFLWFRTTMCQLEGNKCSFFFGSNSDVVSTTFWFVSALAIFIKYPKPEPNPNDDRMRMTEVDDGGEHHEDFDWDAPSDDGINRALPLDDLADAEDGIKYPDRSID